MMYSSGLPALKVHERRKPKCFEKNASCAARLRQFKAMWLIAEGSIRSVRKMPTLHQRTIGQLIDVGWPLKRRGIVPQKAAGFVNNILTPLLWFGPAP